VNKIQRSLPQRNPFLRWKARILSIPLLLATALLFFADGLPFFLFKSDPLHMTALSLLLLGLLAGWKCDAPAAVLILTGFLAAWILISVRFGMIIPGLGPIFSFAPLIALNYLIRWYTMRWQRSSPAALPDPTEKEIP